MKQYPHKHPQPLLFSHVTWFLSSGVVLVPSIYESERAPSTGASGPVPASPIISSVQPQWCLFIFRAKHCWLFYFTTFKRAWPRLVSYPEKRAIRASENWARLFWARWQWLRALTQIHARHHRSSVHAATHLMRDFIRSEAQSGHQGQADIWNKAMQFSYMLPFFVSLQFCFACETGTWWQSHVTVLPLNEGLCHLDSLW